MVTSGAACCCCVDTGYEVIGDVVVGNGVTSD